jgi:transcriptional regulator with XRE-family HTH domain
VKAIKPMNFMGLLFTDNYAPSSGLNASARNRRCDVTEPALTPAQLLEARMLLKWSRDRLAAKMGVSHSVIARFESSSGVMRVFDAKKARAVFEAADVEFIAENDGGAGVRLRKARPAISDEAAVPEMPEGVAKDYDGSAM